MLLISSFAFLPESTREGILEVRPATAVGHVKVFCVRFVMNRICIQELHATNLCVVGAAKNLDFASPPIGYLDESADSAARQEIAQSGNGAVYPPEVRIAAEADRRDDGRGAE